MKIRTRNDIFVAINRRMVEIEENDSQDKVRPDLNKREEVIDLAITAAARIIRVIENDIITAKRTSQKKTRRIDAGY